MVSSVVYIITGNCSWLSLSMMGDGDGPPNKKLCWHGLRDAAIFHAALIGNRSTYAIIMVYVF
jgi:hypothetical protein